MPDFKFAIDLACLASKRDFLKLDKWLEDRQAEHGVSRVKQERRTRSAKNLFDHLSF